MTALIKDRHPQPHAEFWTAHAQSAPPILRQMYGETHSTYEKARILESLAWYKEAETTQLLKSVARREKNPYVISRAVRSVAVSQGLREESYLTQMSRHSDPIVRRDALSVLDRLYQKARLTQDAKEKGADQPVLFKRGIRSH